MAGMQVLAELAEAEAAEDDLLLPGSRPGAGMRLRRRLGQARNRPRSAGCRECCECLPVTHCSCCTHGRTRAALLTGHPQPVSALTPPLPLLPRHRRPLQAGRAAQHSAALLRRWPSLKDAPFPSLLLLVIHQDLLPPSLLLDPRPAPPAHSASASFTTGPGTPAAAGLNAPPPTAHSPAAGLRGRARSAAQRAGGRLRQLRGALAPSSAPSSTLSEGAALDVLSELQRLVALAGALGMRPLLAVVTREGLDAGAPRRLAASLGLEAAEGFAVVVPVLEVPVATAAGGRAGGGTAAEGGHSAVGQRQLGSGIEQGGGVGQGPHQQVGGTTARLSMGPLQLALYGQAAALHQEAAEQHLLMASSSSAGAAPPWRRL